MYKIFIDTDEIESSESEFVRDSKGDIMKFKHYEDALKMCDHLASKEKNSHLAFSVVEWEFL